MNISLIGAGNVGRALAGSFVRAGHAVTLSSAHPETARAAADDVGAKAADSNVAAAAAAEVVVLAVPYPALPQILDELGDGLRGKVVVDATNPLRADYMGLATEGTSGAEVRSIGFRPIDAGPLEMARALEAMALLNITLQIRNSWSGQSAWKLVGPTGA